MNKQPVQIIVGSDVAIRPASVSDSSFGWSLRQSSHVYKRASKFDAANCLIEENNIDKALVLLDCSPVQTEWSKFVAVTVSRRADLDRIKSDTFGLKSRELEFFRILLQVNDTRFYILDNSEKIVCVRFLFLDNKEIWYE